MGVYFTRHFRQDLPLEENHRVVIDDGRSSTNVDPEPGSCEVSRIGSLLQWCRQNQCENGYLLKRNFIQIPNGGNALSRTGPQFRVMQWNTLADALGRGRDNFIKCPREAMLWDNRKLHLLEEMLIYTPDIICCQEIDHYEFFRGQLSRVGYKGAFLPKPWSPCLNVSPNNGPDGCAIFFKNEKFELVDYKAVMLETMTFSTHHAALFLLLRLKGDQFSSKDNNLKDSFILVGTTHLKAKSGYEKLRDCQGRDILRFLEPYATTRTPIILCGDFNAKPEELVYQRIKNCKKPNFRSAYAQVSGNEPRYTTWCIRGNGENMKTVDYVFYSKEYFTVESILELPSPEALGPGKLPSLAYPSDHLSLVCDFCLLTNDSSPLRVLPKI